MAKEHKAMNAKRKFKLILDGALFTLLIASIGAKITGNEAHEIIGAALFGLFFAHISLNFRFFKNAFKSKFNTVKIIAKTLNFTLLALFTCL